MLKKLLLLLISAACCMSSAFAEEAGKLSNGATSGPTTKDIIALIVVFIVVIVFPICMATFTTVIMFRARKYVKKAKARLKFEAVRIFKPIRVPVTENAEAREQVNALYAEYAEAWIGGSTPDELRDCNGIAPSAAATEAAFETLEKMKAVPGAESDVVAVGILNVFGTFANRSQERENIHPNSFRQGGAPLSYSWLGGILTSIAAVLVFALWIFVIINFDMFWWGHLVFLAIIFFVSMCALLRFTHEAIADTIFQTPRRLLSQALNETWFCWTLKAIAAGDRVDRGFSECLKEKMASIPVYITESNGKARGWISQKDKESAESWARFDDAVRKGIRGQIAQIIYGFVLPYKVPAVYRRNFES